MQYTGFTTKDYRDNEKRIMKRLGLTPTKNSGSGEIQKGDGFSEHLLCELKSSEKASISVKWFDIHKLYKQAKDENKIPLFVINDLTNDDEYIIIEPQYMIQVAEYLKELQNNKAESRIPIPKIKGEEYTIPDNIDSNVIKSSTKAVRELEKLTGYEDPKKKRGELFAKRN